MKINFTSQMIEEYSNHISKIYNIKITSKKNSFLMKFIAWFLNLFNIMSKKVFMNIFTTTIGKTIYVPFKLGDEACSLSLEGQFVTLIHENQHVLQYMKEGFLFMIKYLISSSARAKYEAEAYSSNLELCYFLHNSLFEISSVANSLKYYNCSQKDIMLATEILNNNVTLIKNGKSICEASAVAILWLEEKFKNV
jgi:hypothetical protein